MRTLLAGVLLLLPILGCQDGTTTPPTTSGVPAITVGANGVTLAAMSYSPANLTVKVGETVTWANNDSVPHTVTSDTRLFHTGQISPGKTATHTFTAAGTYPYHCDFHPHMTGTITVQ